MEEGNSSTSAQHVVSTVACGCGQTFRSRAALHQHQQSKSKHPAGNRRCLDASFKAKPPPKGWQCGCGRRFAHLDALWQHQDDKVRFAQAERCFRPGQKDPPPRAPAAPSRDLAAVEPPVKHYKDLALQRGLAEYSHGMKASLLNASDMPVTSDGQVRLLASYNLTKRGIAVPGVAAQWLPLRLPVKVELRNIPDPMNALPSQEYPFEASFRAMAVLNPEARFNDTDVVCNRNTLKKLLGVCSPKAQQSFRLRLYIVQNTLVIESDEVQRSHQAPLHGYGSAFEKRFSSFPDELSDTACHHRLISYKLGPLNCVVRFQADVSYLPEGNVPDDLKPTLLSKNPTRLPDQSTDQAALLLIGNGTPQNSVAEVKARVQGSNASPSRHMAQFWFGRTRYLIQGRHDARGVVQSVDIREPDLKEWEEREANQLALRRLVTLLSFLRESVRRSERHCLFAVYDDKGATDALQLYALEGQRTKPLPDHLSAIFWSGGKATQP
ncbi:hypothetical protein GGR56DRAFT_55823 [Xylariaceae sp. FL0804]|nr:hypothetical protein GGR56DRAFT_55823 [Xylariaceae sp. FL0804]